MPSWRLFGAVLTLTLAVVGLPWAASATTVDPGDVTSLPPLMESNPDNAKLQGVSPDYVMHSVAADEQGAPGQYTIVRTSGGSTAWSGLVAPADATAVSLAGSDFVAVRGQYDEPGGITVDLTDIETRQSVGSLSLPEWEPLLHVGSGWALGLGPSSLGGSQTSYQLVLHRLDGSTLPLAGAFTTYNAEYVGGDQGHAFVFDDAPQTLYDVDLAAGTATLVSPPPGHQWNQPVVGPTRIYDVSREDYTATSDVWHIGWVSRSGGAGGSVDVGYVASPYRPAMLPYGDGLALYTNNTRPQTLRPLDLTAGQVDAPVATDLSDAEPLGDGRVALVVDSPVPGKVALADPTNGPVDLVDLPPVPRHAYAVQLDGGSVWTTWSEDGTAWSTATDGSQGWTQQPNDTTVSNGITLTQLRDDTGWLRDAYELTWPGGSREVDEENLALGHGGQLVYGFEADSGDYQAQRIQDGQVVADRQAPFVVDGSTVWSLSSDGVLTGTDTSNPDSTPTVLDTGMSCGTVSVPVDVRGRWALTRCQSGYQVVDLRQVVPTWTVPFSSAPGLPAPRLGEGFVVWDTQGSDDLQDLQIHVADLTSAHTEKTIDDPSGAYLGMVPAAAPDVQDTATLVYIDHFYQPRVVYLGWLGQAPLVRPDTTAPTLEDSQGPPSLIDSSSPVPVAFAWTWTDPDSALEPTSGLARYDVRHAVEQHDGSPGPWTTTTGTGRAEWSTTVTPGTGVCVESRATDRQGNTSSWSPAKCTHVDGSAPTLGAASAPRYFGGGPVTQIRYHYRAVDDVAVASYDVQTRAAAPGEDFGSWQLLAGHTTQTSQWLQVRAGSEHCFRFRARDTLGHTSARSTPRCTTLAIDDTAFSLTADTTENVAAFAYRGAYLRLNMPGAHATLPQVQRGHSLALWVIKGPHAGSIDVFVGGVRAGRVPLGGSRRHRALVTLPMPRNGPVKISLHSPRWGGVDALFVNR